jgi:hypothetical protein
VRSNSGMFHGTASRLTRLGALDNIVEIAKVPGRPQGLRVTSE